jgi:hypothetical protein
MGYTCNNDTNADAAKVVSICHRNEWLSRLVEVTIIE